MIKTVAAWIALGITLAIGMEAAGLDRPFALALGGTYGALAAGIAILQLRSARNRQERR